MTKIKLVSGEDTQAPPNTTRRIQCTLPRMSSSPSAMRRYCGSSNSFCSPIAHRSKNPSFNGHYSERHRHRHRSVTGCEEDERFIPSRRGMDTSLCQRALRISSSLNHSNQYTKQKANYFDYKSALMSALCNGNIGSLGIGCQPRKLFFYGNQGQQQNQHKQHHLHNSHENSLANQREYFLPRRSSNQIYSRQHLDWSAQNVLSVLFPPFIVVDFQGKKKYSVSQESSDGHKSVAISWCKNTGFHHYLAIGAERGVTFLEDCNRMEYTHAVRGDHFDLNCNYICCLDWNEQFLTTGGDDGLINVHDLQVTDKHRVQQTYGSVKGGVKSLKWNCDGSILAFTSPDADYIGFLDRRMFNEESLALYTTSSGHVETLDWSPTHEYIFAYARSRGDYSPTKARSDINIVDLMKDVTKAVVTTPENLTSLLWNANGKELYSSHAHIQNEKVTMPSHHAKKNQLKVWKYSNGFDIFTNMCAAANDKNYYDATLTQINSFNGDQEPIKNLARSPDGKTIASTHLNCSIVRIWDVASTASKASLSDQTLASHCQ